MQRYIHDYEQNKSNNLGFSLTHSNENANSITTSWYRFLTEYVIVRMN